MDRSFFPLVSLRKDDEGSYVQRLLAGDLGAVIVEDVLPRSAALSWADRLDAGGVAVTPRRFAVEFDALSFGPCLDQSRNLHDYLERVQPFASSLSGVLPGVDLVPLILSVIGRLAQGWSPTRPVSSDGRVYGLVTLRCLPPGGLIPPHCENEQLSRPPYDELRGKIDNTSLVSFYLVLRPADEGGELSVHRLAHATTGNRMRDGHSDMAHEVENAERVVFAPDAGSLIVFDGGRRFHQVMPVRGGRARWTLGGFLAKASATDAVYVWA
jgi:hapalindole-type alkaloid chlorinase